MKRRVGRDERRCGACLNLGHEDSQPRLAGQLRRPQVERPSDQGVCSAQRHASWMYANRAGSAAAFCRAMPCASCSQAASTTSGSQPQRSASRRPRSSRSVPRSASSRWRRSAAPGLVPPSRHPLGIDGRDGPAAQPAKQPRPCDAVRIRVVGLASQRSPPPVLTATECRQSRLEKSDGRSQRRQSATRAFPQSTPIASINSLLTGRAQHPPRVELADRSRLWRESFASSSSVSASSGRRSASPVGPSAGAAGSRQAARRGDKASSEVWTTRVDTHRAGSFPTTEAGDILDFRSPPSAPRHCDSHLDIMSRTVLQQMISRSGWSPYPKVGRLAASAHRYRAACAENRPPLTSATPGSCLPRSSPRCR